MCCRSDSLLDSAFEIASFPDIDPDFSGWSTPPTVVAEIMEDGWTRYNSDQIFDTTILLEIRLDQNIFDSWLSHANHIFSLLQNVSNYEDYVLIQCISFELTILTPTHDPPEGYLFVCPGENFRTASSSFRWPNLSTYWSLDPGGAEQLSMEDATNLGFPAIELDTLVALSSWESSVYAGLRQFHQAKGFNPESQYGARHLPLFQISSTLGVPFAHVDGEVFDAGPDNERDSHVNIEESTSQESAYSMESAEEEVPAPEAAEIFLSSRSWKTIELVKFVLILALAFGSLYEYARAAVF
ncbi:hypothetical protein DFH07DRAFT_1066983 [Mycena maculata]|uniref:Uncharacterized protein n=1 Tax=Mycena maculata TaxID=230809 RepID=A0AAD7HPQ7_9AGAR|nr:hypothetical protein DFH07DRAFT_1066983 [Mycena maculata]